MSSICTTSFRGLLPKEEAVLATNIATNASATAAAGHKSHSMSRASGRLMEHRGPLAQAADSGGAHSRDNGMMSHQPQDKQIALKNVQIALDSLSRLYKSKSPLVRAMEARLQSLCRCPWCLAMGRCGCLSVVAVLATRTATPEQS
jgi:hypothetical protein